MPPPLRLVPRRTGETISGGLYNDAPRLKTIELRLAFARHSRLNEAEPAPMSTEFPANHPTQSNQYPRLTRRRFIGRVGRFASGVALGATSAAVMTPRAFGAAKARMKVAAVLTEFAYRSHAHVLLENFLEPYL